MGEPPRSDCNLGAGREAKRPLREGRMSTLWLPRSCEPEAGLALPEGDVTLCDGRVLKLRRAEERKPGDIGYIWHGPAGLKVAGEVSRTAKHGPLVHVVATCRARRPSWSDVQRVRTAFFGTRDVMIPFGVDDDPEESRVVHLWEMPASWSSR
jgi:hypothetical protein